MLVAASANGIVGIPAAINVLMNGGSALDAVEVAAKVVEDNPDDHTVGFSGLPNVDGIVELMRRSWDQVLPSGRGWRTAGLPSRDQCGPLRDGAAASRTGGG